jgi:hypothetical protein
MSTYTSEPGTRLAGRYRLVDQVSAGAGWTYWKATDETLARSVTVLTFATGFPRVAETVTAARAASRLSDPRFSQVFDVEDVNELAYVVLEWVAGESLLDMLSEGPLDPPRAAALMSEAAKAVAAAHDAGLAHLRLDPACLHWTPGGGVKIAGLGIHAALAAPDPTTMTSGDHAEDPELTDTRDLARLLYAALTGYWPGHQGSVGAGPGLLPPAPETDGIVCTPRQVSAGVPASIDDVTCRALFQRPNRHGPALSTAAMFADALRRAAPPVPLPVSLASTSAARTPTRLPGGRPYQADGSTNPYPAAPYPEAGTAPRTRTGNGSRKPPSQHSTAARAIVSVVVVLVLAAVGVAAWSASRSFHPSAAPQAAGLHPSAPAAVALLKPVSANTFDALGKNDGSDDPGGAKYTITGSASTPWHTDYYFNYPAFGNLKKGTGLILDLGKQVRLSQVVVQFGTSCCAHAEIEIGNDNNPVPSALSTFTVLASSNTAQGSTTFNVTKETTGRYVLIWLTDLPPRDGYSNQYEAFIYNVTVHGSVVSQSG